MKKLKNMKGITLIALVITIVVLLILAGVTIAMLTGENGILGKATTAKAKSAIEEAKERVNMMLAEWKMEKTINNVSLDSYLKSTSGEYYNQITSYSIIAPVEGPENDRYIATVVVSGINYEVTINAEDQNNPYIEDVAQAGKRLSIVVGQSGDYTFTGTVDIVVTAKAPDGETISSIDLVSGEVVESGEPEGIGTQTASRRYTINKREEYSFNATTNTGNTKSEPIKIIADKILSEPNLTEDAVTSTTDSISIDTNKIADESNYPSSANVQYKYYYKVSTTTEYTETTENPITGLTLGEKYDIKVKAYIGEEKNGKLSDSKSLTLDLKSSDRIYLYNYGDIGTEYSSGWNHIGGRYYPTSYAKLNENNIEMYYGGRVGTVLKDDYLKHYKYLCINSTSESCRNEWTYCNVVCTENFNSYSGESAWGKVSVYTFVNVGDYSTWVNKTHYIDLETLNPKTRYLYFDFGEGRDGYINQVYLSN